MSKQKNLRNRTASTHPQDDFLAPDDRLSMDWRKDLMRTYLKRDVPVFGSRIPAETLRRFWTMLAHNQGALRNASRLAAGLEVSS